MADLPMPSRRRALQAAGITALSAAALAACSPGAGSPEKGPPTEDAPTPDHGAPSQPPPAPTITQPATGISMQPGYAQTIAATAYLWGWPMVNMVNRSAAVTRALKPSLGNGILPMAPRGRLAMLSDYIDPNQSFVACPNQDVVYGLAYLSLDEETVIAQVPDFGDRFWVYALYDARTDQFGQLGKQYGTTPGFYLLVGPNWTGDKPDGAEAVITCPTALANAIPRVFMADTVADRQAIQPVINGIDFYPLREFDGTVKTTEWSKLPVVEGPPPDAGGETKWVVPERFFDQLGNILDTVAPLPGEQALYGQFRALLDTAASAAATKKVLVDTALATEDSVITPFFRWTHNGVPAGNGWNRSTNNAQWGVDYFNRTGTAKSNIFENRPAETVYFYTDTDSAGDQLDGSRSYEITFPSGQEPPVRGFWSLTLYNDRHFFYPNALNRYSLGTKNDTLRRNPDGSLTLYAGSTSPGQERESNWLPAPVGAFSLYIRSYWSEQAVFDGTWKPPQILAR